MPAKVKVRILGGRGLPIMDRASDLTDAFVEVRFGNVTQKTDVFRKSLNPIWNSEWFRFEVDDEDLQDEPLQLRVLDYDTYSAHDAIGKVYINLNPLLSKDSASSICGWFPIYDTMHGIRGEINVIVKLELFTDVNRYRQSSCGVQFFGSTCVPYGYRAQAIYGFVEELVVNDDPEYQWIDKIRTPRASNETRQRLFSTLSGELQRRIGLKVLEMGGNAIIGYRQCFDLEGESGIVVRGIGSAVSIVKQVLLSSPPSCSPVSKSNSTPNASIKPASKINYSDPTTPTRLASPFFAFSFVVPEESAVVTTTANVANVCATAPPLMAGSANPFKLSTSPTARLPGQGMPVLSRRLSDSELGSPKGSLTGSSGSGADSLSARIPSLRPLLPPQSIEILEYPFFTITSFPAGFIVHLGGVVSARSVKLLDRIHNPEEPETRDAWWIEIRTEMRSHARAMGCHAVVGYVEHTSICDEIIVLSATGTAAIVNMSMEKEQLRTQQQQQQLLTMSLDRTLFDREKEKEKDKKLHIDVNLANQQRDPHGSESDDAYDCSLSHVPYNETSAPFPVSLSRCTICKRGKVPDVLFTTVEPPVELVTVGKGCLVQARICRPKKEAKAGESNAKEVSDNLPFMEYELHSQLMNKLKVKGMNALFGLKIQVEVGETMLIAVATATAAYIAALPSPPVPRVSGKEDNSRDKDLLDIQKKLVDTVNKNKDRYELSSTTTDSESGSKGPPSDSEEELSELDMSAGNKDTYIIELDDAEDKAVVSVLFDSEVPDGFYACNTEFMPGLCNLVTTLQMFTRVWRGEVKAKTNQEFSNILEGLIRGIFFKLRKLSPCLVCDLSFDLDLPDESYVQVAITAICAVFIEQADSVSLDSSLGQDKPISKSEADDMMFHMEEDGVENVQQRTRKLSGHGDRRSWIQQKPIQKYGVELTPLSYIPGGRIDTYLGHLNFFYIRESTSLRENGGLSGFMHSFIAEVMAIVRAHVVALGGNAMVAYRMSECVLLDNPNRNQGQCLINVSGDAVQVIYDADMNPAIQLAAMATAKADSPSDSAKSSTEGRQAGLLTVDIAKANRRGGRSPVVSPNPAARQVQLASLVTDV